MHKSISTNKVLNNNSIVCKMNFKKRSIHFTGDIEKIAEEKIIEIFHGKKIKCDILKIAHHGSKSSSIQEFLKVASPKIALIGVGINNKFGHPDSEVINRLKKENVKIYRTDINGEVETKIYRNGIIKILNK